MYIPIKERIIIALDVPSLDEAVGWAGKLKPEVGIFKAGMQLCNAAGTPNVLKAMKWIGVQVFVDEKFHDIPNTVGQAAKTVSGLGATFFNVMASGGVDMMLAAEENKGDAKLLAVTVLTSREENEAHLSLGGPIKAKVLQFAREGKLAGVDGYILSPQEVEFLQKRKELFLYYEPEFITPGVRPIGTAVNDQKRYDTAYRSVFLGATRIVVGRPVLKADDPLAVVRQLKEEIFKALRDRWLMSLFDAEKKHVKFGAFKLKLHELHPEAPLSPVYINMREMQQSIIDRMAELMYEISMAQDLRYDYVIGIPKAGEPIAEAFCRLAGKPMLKMVKQEATAVGGRKITSTIIGKFEPGKKVLLIDDLITQADTKLEAFAGVEANGLMAMDLLLGMDREQGGVEILQDQGKNVYAVSKLKDSLNLFVREEKIDEAKKKEVIEYLDANRVTV